MEHNRNVIGTQICRSLELVNAQVIHVDFLMFYLHFSSQVLKMCDQERGDEFIEL